MERGQKSRSALFSIAPHHRSYTLNLELTKLYTFVGGKFIYLYQYSDTSGDTLKLYHADLFQDNSAHLSECSGTLENILEWVLTLELPKLVRVKVV